MIGYIALGWFAIIAALMFDLQSHGRAITPGFVGAAIGIASYCSAFWLVCAISVMISAKKNLSLINRWAKKTPGTPIVG